MNIYTLTKRGLNFELKITDSVSGAILSYFLDSANFEVIYMSGDIVTFNLYGYISFNTLKISSNNCLYIDGGSGAVLITDANLFQTNYEILFT